MSHQPNKKSLRRKPPPIDDSTPFSIYQNLTSNPEQYSDFQVSLSKTPPIQVNTFVQSSPPNYIQLPPSAPPPPIPVQRPEYTLQVGSFPEAASAPMDQTNYNVSMSLEFPLTSLSYQWVARQSRKVQSKFGSMRTIVLSHNL